MNGEVNPLIALLLACSASWLGYGRARLVIADLRAGEYRHAFSGVVVATRASNSLAFWFGIGSRVIVIAICAMVLAMATFGVLK